MAKRKKGRAVKPRKDIETKYRRNLFSILGGLQDKFMSLARAIISGEYSEEQAAIELREIESSIIGKNYRDSVEKFISKADSAHAGQLNSMFRKSFGIDVIGLIKDVPTKRMLERKTSDNIKLIKDMRIDQLGKIREAVIANYRGEDLTLGRSLIEQVDHIGKVGKSRARLIARDQTSKLNSALNETRQAALGIEEYIWITSRDERVVGKPGGKYPKGNPKHMNHHDRHGKTFRWDSPPPDGNPGEPINCRCVARPVIDVRRIAELKRRKAA